MNFNLVTLPLFITHFPVRPTPAVGFYLPENTMPTSFFHGVTIP